MLLTTTTSFLVRSTAFFILFFIVRSLSVFPILLILTISFILQLAIDKPLSYCRILLSNSIDIFFRASLSYLEADSIFKKNHKAAKICLMQAFGNEFLFIVLIFHFFLRFLSLVLEIYSYNY